MDKINLSALAILVTNLKTAKIRIDAGEGTTYDELQEYRLEKMLEILPSGSGINSGIQLDMQDSGLYKLVFDLEYHHLHEMGYYEGVTEHKVIINPMFGDYYMQITGENKNGVIDYLHDTLNNVFTISDTKGAIRYLNSICGIDEWKQAHKENKAV